MIDFCSFARRSILGWKWYLGNHLRASQSARAKSIIRLCGVSNSNAVGDNNNNSELYLHEYNNLQ